MVEPTASASPTPMETTETNASPTEGAESAITNEQWRAITRIIDNIYGYREQDGHDPSKVFHRKVNKRSLPDYYDVIKEPVALSTLKSKRTTKEYKTFAEFVRDCALIPHNAQTYNRPEAGAYQDAIVLKSLFEKEFKQLAEDHIITADEATLPDLGEIPPASPRPLEEDEEEDDDDDEDDEDEDIDDSDDEGKRKKRRGPRSLAAIKKREGASKDEDGPKGGETDPRKRRGRPPRVDTPMEARIKAVLKGIRKYKNDAGQIMIHQFEKLPDKSTMPEYYQEIKDPIAIELIKRKQKRKKYQSVDHFMRDVDTMFNNAQSYNQDESQIYKDAVYLQKEAHSMANAEKAKPDTEYVMEEGRLPLPNGIVYNGELWKVGDWVHIQNPNDVTKPIVAQIYRTWQDSESQKWVNACWYYRPEQTVHQYEKHFYPSEVVKTGQYRDHRVDEIVDRCFVMFCTRYSRGRPRGFPSDKEVYVCDSRYNEEKHKLNKIKTWASCLPDEVRDKDYEMDLFDGLKRVKKVPSPILHLLPADAKETDEMPKPRWGVDNAPPVVGAVYKGPRDENQSPPPEPTPSPPPPQPPPPPPRQVSHIPHNETPSYRRKSEVDSNMASPVTQPSVSAPTAARVSHSQTYAAQIPQYQAHSTPAAPTHSQHYSQQPVPSYSQPHQASGMNTVSTATHHDHYSTPQSRYAHPASVHRSSTSAAGYNPPRPMEVYHLPESANNAIPQDIREQFQRDDKGNVLFFTAPPVDVLPPANEGSVVGHTAKYLANKLRRKMALKEQRNAAGLPEDEQAPAAKKMKIASASPSQKEIERIRDQGLRLLIDQMNQGTEQIYQDIYGDRWEEGIKYEREKLALAQENATRRKLELEVSERKREEQDQIVLRSSGLYLDDYNPRY